MDKEAWFTAVHGACNAGDPGLIPQLIKSPGEVIGYLLQHSWKVQMLKNQAAMWRSGLDPWVGKFPWRKAWQPTSVFFPGEPPLIEKPGGLQSMVSQSVRHN